MVMFVSVKLPFDIDSVNDSFTAKPLSRNARESRELETHSEAY